MRISAIFSLKWSDVLYEEGLIAAQAKLKGGKVRYVPLAPELNDRFCSCGAQLPTLIARNNRGRTTQMLVTCLAPATAYFSYQLQMT
jgi:hypothetical protein